MCISPAFLPVCVCVCTCMCACLCVYVCTLGPGFRVHDEHCRTKLRMWHQNPGATSYNIVRRGIFMATLWMLMYFIHIDLSIIPGAIWTGGGLYPLHPLQTTCGAIGVKTIVLSRGEMWMLQGRPVWITRQQTSTPRASTGAHPMSF